MKYIKILTFLLMGVMTLTLSSCLETCDEEYIETHMNPDLSKMVNLSVNDIENSNLAYFVISSASEEFAGFDSGRIEYWQDGYESNKMSINMNAYMPYQSYNVSLLRGATYHVQYTIAGYGKTYTSPVTTFVKK